MFECVVFLSLLTSQHLNGGKKKKQKKRTKVKMKTNDEDTL